MLKIIDSGSFNEGFGSGKFVTKTVQKDNTFHSNFSRSLILALTSNCFKWILKTRKARSTYEQALMFYLVRNLFVNRNCFNRANFRA